MGFISLFICWKWKLNQSNKPTTTQHTIMGNTAAHCSSSKNKNKIHENIERDKNIPTRIIDSKDQTQNNNENDENPITSAAKSVYGGITGMKNYLFGSSKSEQHEESQQIKYRNSAVFIRLKAPNYYFANQGLQWVKDPMYFDEE